MLPRFASVRLVVGIAIVAWTLAPDALARHNATATSAYVATDLGTLGGDESLAYAVNGAGQVVGWSESDSGRHAFRWQDGTMTDLGTLEPPETTFPSPALHSEAIGINEAGDVVGWGNLDVFGPRRAIIWQDGVITDLGTLGSLEDESDTVATAINGNGQIVGSAETETADQSAFLWQGGEMHDLGDPEVESLASDINDAGQVVGWAEVTDRRPSAVLWEADGTMVELGQPAVASTALAINAAGQVVGWFETADGGSRACLWDDGVLTDLGTLGGAQSIAIDINEAGQIVGMAETAGGVPHAFVWENGTMTDLGTFGGAQSVAHGINEAGQVVGQAETAEGPSHAVLWSR